MPILDRELEDEQERLIATHDVVGAVYFAVDNENTADIRALQSMIINHAIRNKNGEGLLLFAKMVEQANKEALGVFISITGDIKSLIDFVKNVKGIKEKSLKRFVKKILQSPLHNIEFGMKNKKDTEFEMKDNTDLIREASSRLKEEHKADKNNVKNQREKTVKNPKKIKKIKKPA